MPLDSSKPMIGITFSPLGNQGLPPGEPIRRITVSPASDQHMTSWYKGPHYDYQRYYSVDGGSTWNNSTWDNSLAFMPFNAREGVVAYHPTDPTQLFGVGGDWVSHSSDGGKTFAWSSNGYNAVMVGGAFAFSMHSPNTIFFGFQDYNGAFTKDYGETWTYTDVSGNSWGGQSYAGFALNQSTFVVGGATAWESPRVIKVTSDAGQTWSTPLNASGLPHQFRGLDVSCGHPVHSGIVFASNFRSIDGGATWTDMVDCAAVLAHQVVAGNQIRLFGSSLSSTNNHSVVMSNDDGATWQSLFSHPAQVKDIAYHPQGLFIVSNDKLSFCENETWACQTVQLPPDSLNATRVKSVAVDPQDSSRVFVANQKDLYTASNSVVASLDGGKTWSNAISDELEVPHEVGWVRVHPTTGDLWAAGSCFGVWRLEKSAGALKNVAL